MMVSAEAREFSAQAASDQPHDDYLIKPFELPELFDRIQTLLDIEWIYDPMVIARADAPGFVAADLPRRHIDALRQLGEIGHLRGIEAKLAEIESERPESAAFVDQLRLHARGFDFDRYRIMLGAVGEDAE